MPRGVIVLNKTIRGTPGETGPTGPQGETGPAGPVGSLGLERPVGSVYLSITGVNPAIELGYGTWVQVGQDQILVGAS